jgi:hypothetical protein
MKKQILSIMLCCVLLLLCGCNKKTEKFKRISFDGETSSANVEKYIHDDTVVTNQVNTAFANQLPIYEIEKHEISDLEFRQMEKQLGITDWYWNESDGNKIYSRIAPYNDPVRGYFYTLEMTDKELEHLAWETFNKIPFLKGEYVYSGITATMTGWSMDEGEFVSEVTVSFSRTLDGIRIVDNDRCDLTFDASGLVELYITLFDYQKIGTMDLISLQDATTRIKTPDYFYIDEGEATISALDVDEITISLVNQFSRGCTILQPIYTFRGTATLEDGNQSKFKSRVIAIPETYTYEDGANGIGEEF